MIPRILYKSEQREGIKDNGFIKVIFINNQLKFLRHTEENELGEIEGRKKYRMYQRISYLIIV